MRVYDHITFWPGGREESFDDVERDFPYLAIKSDHDYYQGNAVPWHWHQELELFYVEQGPIEYETLHERAMLPTGAAGLVNANVLHMTKTGDGKEGRVLLVHIFHPRFLAETNTRIDRLFIQPLITTTSIELVALLPTDASSRELREALATSFETVRRGEDGWELRLRNELAGIWLQLVERVRPLIGDGPSPLHARDERLKTMMAYVALHYPERIGVAQIAQAGGVSERECYRTFQATLGVTPAHYLRVFRMEQACRMLVHTTRPISTIGALCGLGTPSHFGHAFRGAMGCTPTEYRTRWHDYDRSCQTTE